MSERQLLKAAKKSIELQQEESDCGVAALLSIIKYHKGYVPLERLRQVSGTTSSGTTMLGLLQASRQNGLDCEAYEGNIHELKKLKSPTLLHVLKHDSYEHYIVCYGQQNEKHIIGDPEEGVIAITDQELEQIWKSKALLTFEPTENLIPAKKNWKDKIKWLREAIQKDKSIITSTILLGVIITTLSFTTAIFTEKLIDNLLPSGDTSRIVLSLLAWFFLMSIRTFMSYMREQVLLRQTYSLNNQLVGLFLDKIFWLPKHFFDRRKKGDLISRLIDTEKVQSSISIVIGQDMIDILTLLVSILIVFLYQPFMAIFLLILVPAYFVIVRKYYEQLYKSNIQVMSSFARNESEYIDQLTGIETIKQLNKSKEISSHLRSQFQDYQSQVMSAGNISVKFKLTNDFFGLLAVFFILSYSVASVLENAIQVGDMLAVFSICSISLASTNRIALAAAHLQEAQAALDRTYDLISEPSEQFGNKTLSGIDNIQLRHISFGFPGTSLLLDSVSLSINKGEIVSIIGDNGSGKSTILQLIQGFYPVNSGEILINNTELAEISNPTIREKIGVVPQEIKIFNYSLAYNITLDQSIKEEELLSFLDKLNLLSYFQSFPQGIDTILGEEGIKASGGQKQMIGLARALFSKPDILLLDEFTSSMDKESELFALELVRTLKSTMGVLLISHEEKITNIADRIYQFMDRSLIGVDN